MPAEPGCVSNWYLKGFLGITSYDLDGISSATFKEGSGFGGLGLGYQFNSWLRFDVTGEYRNRSTVHGLDRYEGYGFSGTNQYTATLKSWVMLANAYWDIGCWKGITPYVGGGIGYAKNWVGDYTDVNVPNLGVSCANTHDEGNFRLGLACRCVLRRDAELHRRPRLSLSRYRRWQQRQESRL